MVWFVQWFDLEEAPTGKLHLKLEWLSLFSNPDKMDQVNKPSTPGVTVTQ